MRSLKPTKGALLHVAAALGIMVVTGGPLALAYGPAAGAMASALIAAAWFVAWEVGQSRVKDSRTIRWAEAVWPAGVSIAIGLIAQVAL